MSSDTTEDICKIDHEGEFEIMKDIEKIPKKLSSDLQINTEENKHDSNNKENACAKANRENSTVDFLSKKFDNMCLKEENIRNIVTIPEWLKDCESPFSWDLEQERGLGADLVIMRNLAKLDELLIEEPEFSQERFVAFFKLILEYYIIGDIDKAWENMKTVEGCLEEEMMRNDPLYQKVKLSLGHVLSATKAHLYFIIGDEKESMKIGRCIIPTKIMADSDKAALYAMKAGFFLYTGYEKGEEVGVIYARKALELEPANSEWEYLLAKILRQQRKKFLFSMEIPRDEMKLLESAVEKDKNPKYLVYLAQVYRECSTQAFRQYRDKPGFFNSDLHKAVEAMAMKALDYYKDALSLQPDSPFVLRRVGYGIMNLPKKVADHDLALKCLLESLEISEIPMTLHVLGTFYLRYKNDNEKALEYFKRAAKTGSQAGLFDMIRVKWMMDKTYDPRPDLEVGLSWNLKKNDHNKFLVQLGGYYLFIKRDLIKAIEYFKPIISEDKDSYHMKNFKSQFLRMSEPIDLNRYLANEALLMLQKHESNSAVKPETSDEEDTSCTPPNLGSVEDFLDIISELHPQLMEMTPDPDLIPNLIQASKEMESNWGNMSHRGRGNFSSGQRGRGRGGYYSGRGSNEGYERRGRFSGANQLETGPNEGERRGRFPRGRGRNENWRQKPRDDSERDQKKCGGNWRSK